MDTEKIHSLLTELHRELADAEELPEGLADKAREVMSDLKGALPAGSPEEHHGAVERLEEVAAGFDANHPQLASAARQIATALGRMGI